VSFSKAGCAAVMAACLIALTPAGVLASVNNQGHHYGKLNNPGHHYGQLKHHHHTPAPSPQPQPNPQPAPQPQSGPATGAHYRTLVAATQPETFSIGGAMVGIPNFPIVFPVATERGAQIAFAPAGPGGTTDWLILVVLPLLLAIWLLVMARLALAAARRRRQAQPAT
jgi:hypothetical protein